MAYSRRRTNRSNYYGGGGRAAAPARRPTRRRSPARSGRASSGVNTLRLVIEQTGGGMIARPAEQSYPFAPVEKRKIRAKR
jgi:hypothetical protein